MFNLYRYINYMQADVRSMFYAVSGPSAPQSLALACFWSLTLPVPVACVAHSSFTLREQVASTGSDSFVS